MTNIKITPDGNPLYNVDEDLILIRYHLKIGQNWEQIFDLIK